MYSPTVRHTPKIPKLVAPKYRATRTWTPKEGRVKSNLLRNIQGMPPTALRDRKTWSLELEGGSVELLGSLKLYSRNAG